MADGKTHDLHGILAAVIVAAVVWVFWAQGASHHLWALPLGTLAGTTLFSPDLDMWNTTPTRRWGPLRILWAPYCWAFDHRGHSHGWITGPASRLIYFGVPVALGWWYFEFVGFGPWVGFLTGGIVFGNWVHLVGDRN